MLLQALCIISYPLVNSNLSYSPETPNLGKIQGFLEMCDLEIWQMTLKNNRTPLLPYFKLCASFRSHWWIQTGATVRKRPIWVKFHNFQSRVTLKFDWWPWKRIGHNSNWSYSPETHKLGQIRRFLEPCDLKIWRMTLKNNRAPLQCYFKLCASFLSHWWIQTWVTVQKPPIWVKIGNF